jgi:hypothetical protein
MAKIVLYNSKLPFDRDAGPVEEIRCGPATIQLGLRAIDVDPIDLADITVDALVGSEPLDMSGRKRSNDRQQKIDYSFQRNVISVSAQRHKKAGRSR